MENILYTYGENLYVNLTNKCPCSCDFCVRNQREGLGSADCLWLERDPSAREVIAEFAAHDLGKVGEVIFCGYGEPFCALDTLLEVCRWLRENSAVKIRVNTNGLGDLIHEKRTPPLLKGLVDAVSVSMNTSDAGKYDALCHPAFGEVSYSAMLQFAKDCLEYVPEVKFSVVDVIPPEEIEACRRTAQSVGVPLRVRRFAE